MFNTVTKYFILSITLSSSWMVFAGGAHEFRILWKDGVKGFRYKEYKGKVIEKVDFKKNIGSFDCTFRSNNGFATVICKDTHGEFFVETTINCNEKDSNKTRSNLKIGPIKDKFSNYHLIELECTFGKESNAAFLIKD